MLSTYVDPAVIRTELRVLNSRELAGALVDQHVGRGTVAPPAVKRSGNDVHRRWLVGIAVAMASLSIGGDDSGSRAEQETEQFMLEARFVSEQTVLNQEVIGLFWEPRSTSGTTEISRLPRSARSSPRNSVASSWG